MQSTVNNSQTTLSQRRGKIARLPRETREELNSRLDDGQEAAQILPWLNKLPEVREAMSLFFNDAPISPQNLSAWRQGGFQEWLLHNQLLDSAAHLRENVEELEDVVAYDSSSEMPLSLADHLVTQLTARFAAFMGLWDGRLVDSQLATLLKVGQFLLKLQQASYRAERAAFELPRMRREAQMEVESDLRREVMEDIRREKQSEKKEKKKPGTRSGATVQSRSIKAAKGSRPNPGSWPESAEPTVVENVEFGQDGPHSPHASPVSHSSQDSKPRIVSSPLEMPLSAS
jgi:hypothetical protein